MFSVLKSTNDTFIGLGKQTISSFLFFRLFDILKPSLIGWADKKNGALGVMLDDIFAGIAAAICTITLAVLYHGL